MPLASLRVGMQWPGEDLRRGLLLDDLPQVHHDDPVRQVPHRGEVVRDEQIRHAEARLEVLQEVHDLGANRHVERGDGLVEDDQGGIERERPRHRESLAHPAAELVRIVLRHVGIETDRADQLQRAFLALPARHAQVDQQRLGHDRLGAHAGVQRAPGILEHGLDRRAIAAQLGALQLVGDPALVHDASGRGTLEQQDQPGGRGLAASRLADEGDRLVGTDLEGHVVDRVDVGSWRGPRKAPAQREVLHEVLDLQSLSVPRRLGGAHACFQQLTRCCGLGSISGGKRSRQTSIAWAQRGTKGHPPGLA